MKQRANQPSKAVIYCRVSSDRQVKEGDGLRSQQTRCREHAKTQHCNVLRVFNDEGVSGSLPPSQRPATQELFAYLDTQKDRFYVIVDDISRIARSMEAYIEFSAKLAARGAILISPSQTFGSSSNEKLVSNVLMAVSAFQRDANIEQVINRQKSRIQNGYWVFHAPIGYKYVKDTGGGKVMVRDEPKASVITEAFEGFAAGRFETQADVSHFITKSGAFKIDRTGRFHPSRVKIMLTCMLYTGFIEYQPWDVTLREGKHPALVEMTTYVKVQERLGLKAKAPYRKDLREEFPLRGFVLCACCNEPLTAGWSKGRNGKHPYYHCKTKGCSLYGKSIKRDAVEGEFKNIIKAMTPSETVLEIARGVITDAWKKKRSEYTSQLMDVDRDKKMIDQQIQGFMGRLLEVEDRTIVSLYENHIKELELNRQILSAQAKEMHKVDTSIEGALGTVFDFIGKPLSLWDSDDLDDKRLVLKLAFAKQLPFSKDSGFGTAAYSLPFSVLRDIHSQESKVVEEEGFEPSNSEEDRFTVCCH
jgi:site-specific DNA recombinase